MTKRQQDARDEIVRRFVNKQRKRQAAAAGRDEFDAIPPDEGGTMWSLTSEELAAAADPRRAR